MVSKYIISVTASLTVFFAATADSPLKFNGDDVATAGIVIRDLRTGHDVVSQNSKKLFSPASTMKLVTSATALSILGDDFRYSTDAYIQGNIINGVLSGNIVINASGDPTLYSEYFPQCHTFMGNIVRQLSELGVSTIAGEIIINDNSMPEQGQVPTWEIDDASYSYGAGHYAFNYADNVFRLNTGEDTSAPFIPGLETIIEPADSVKEIIHGINSPLYIVRGPKVLNPDYSVVVPMFNPAEVFISALTDSIENCGICFTEPTIPNTPDSIPLATAFSPRLHDILKSLMTRSDNMMAESTLRLIARNRSRAKAIENETRFLESREVNCEFTCIRDGSGLSRSNCLSPSFLADVLEMMSKNDNAQSFVKLFPRAGMEGTMRSFLAKSPLQGRLVMKTGSMSHVRCYAGYLLDKKNNLTHAVVIMVNNYLGKTANLKTAIEKYLLNNLK